MPSSFSVLETLSKTNQGVRNDGNSTSVSHLQDRMALDRFLFSMTPAVALLYLHI